MTENLKILFNKIAEEHGYSNSCVDVQEMPSTGGNFSSTLYLATISAPPKEELKLFAKVSKIGEDLRATSKIFHLSTETERYFYTELAVAFQELYNKHNVPEQDRLYIPKYYGSNDINLEETLVLENLAIKGFGEFDRLKPFDWEYASRSFEELAKFHALGLAYRQENQKELERLGNAIFIDIYSNEEIINAFMKQAYIMGTQVIKEEYRDRVRKYFDENNLLDAVAKLWKPAEGGFLIHADYRPSNLLNMKKNGKLEVVIIDYQTLHLGTLAADLMYFIWQGSDSEFRQKFYQQLLEHYYQALALALRRLHLDICEVYPRRVFEQELEDTKTLGLYIGLGMTTLLTVEPENAPQLTNYKDFMVRPNQLAVDRMNGVAEDYIKWGII